MTGESKKERDIWSDGEFGKEKDNSGKRLCDIRNNKFRDEDFSPLCTPELLSLGIHAGTLGKGISGCKSPVVDSGLCGLTY